MARPVGGELQWSKVNRNFFMHYWDNMSKENGPLNGLRVLDLANEFGVYCGKLLSGLGADVIKVEKPGGDSTRNIGPFYENDPCTEKSLFFAYHNTGKRSITLNLVSKDGQEILKKLAKVSDVVIETFPVGYMVRLGLDYATLKTLNSRLVMTSITPFGQSGPYQNWHASSDIIPYAMGGLMYMTGAQSMPPLQMGNLLVGHGASLYAAVGTLALIHNRLFTGEGDHLDISLQECVASWLDTSYCSYQLPPYQITERMGSQALMRTPAQNYPCIDGYFHLAGMGRWNLIVSWLVDQGIEVGDLIDSKYEGASNCDKLLWDVRSRINRAIEELGMRYTKMEIMKEGQRRGIPVTIVANANDVDEDVHVKAREYFVEVQHPVLGKLKYAGAPYKFSESPWKVGGAAPLIGQHNEEIYGELGFSKQDLAILRAEGAI
jgi:benzylsuccinate CoA-transferase BbsE subunit